MAEIHEKIKELEDGLKQLVKKTDAIRPEGLGYIQQKAIISFANGCRGLQGCELGELKNAFEMGDNKKLTQAVKAVK